MSISFTSRAKIAFFCIGFALLSACQSTPSASAGNSEVARSRTALAAEFIRANKLDDAKRQLEQAIDADKNYAPAYDMMGVLYQTEGSEHNLSVADAQFKRAIALDPQFMRAHNNYGVYLNQVGRLEDAVREFSLAGGTLGYDGRGQSLENLGRVYLRLGKQDLAVDAFNRAIDADNQVIQARIELIDILLTRGQFLPAKRLYDELNFLAQGQDLPANVLLQGIKIADYQGAKAQRQALIARLLALYPLSPEAVQVKQWLLNGKFS